MSLQSSQKKIIKVNTDYFNVGGNKTRKNRESGEKSPKPLIINQNSLKKQFLNRIKEHKLKEAKKKEITTTEKSEEDKNYVEAKNSVEDEFYDSINYLSTLSKNRKEQKKLETMAGKTMKKYESQHSESPHVELNLPPELQEYSMPTNPPITLRNVNSGNDVPYGCLKNGSKPTYRTWNATRKNTFSSIDDYVAPTPLTEREKKLDSLKLRMAQKQQVQTEEKNNNILATQNIVRGETHSDPFFESEFSLNDEIIEQANLYKDEEETAHALKSVVEIEKTKEIDRLMPKRIKKTVRRRYTLGKSTVYRKVGVLMKDKETRKKIMNAQKELKKQSIHDVKKYLKEHGLIKIGSVAPNDVVRKTYEAAMMTGEIVNTNKDILLHNFLTDTKE